MATTKTFIENLQDKKNIDIIQILKSFVYGTKQLKVYSEGKVYNYRDIVIKYCDDVKRFVTFRCTVNTSLPTWDDSQWQQESAVNTLLAIEDKLIINSPTKPTNIENKVWYETIKDNEDGSKNVHTHIKNKDKTYDKLYGSTLFDNVYTTSDESLTLKEKFNKNDIDLNRIRSRYIIDATNNLNHMEVLMDEINSDFTTIINASDLTIEGICKRNKSIIIV